MAAAGKPPLSIPCAEQLSLDALAPGEIHQRWVILAEDALSEATRIPVIVVRGKRPGPVFGVTAALHGNELNGMPTIHGLVAALDPERVSGSVVAVPVSNVTAFLANMREHRDGQDLNRILPGRRDGNEAEVFAHSFIGRIVQHFDFLVDLHTASFGRANSFYLRADLSLPKVCELAPLTGVDIIVDVQAAEGTLRAAATQLGVTALTIEVGDANCFQQSFITRAEQGILRLLERVGMFDASASKAPPGAVVCSHSYWSYTDRGGILNVLPELASRIRKGDLVATLVDPFGNLIREYHAPEDAIVVGKATHPLAHEGARILHLGIVK